MEVHPRCSETGRLGMIQSGGYHTLKADGWLIADSYQVDYHVVDEAA